MFTNSNADDKQLGIERVQACRPTR